MKPHSWAKISHLFNAAADLGSADRRECIRAAGLSSTQRKVLESLLRYRGVTLQAPLARVSGSDGSPLRGRAEGNATTATTHPEWVGRYRILHVLGSGGMGVVYAAEQELPRRTVALKLIVPGFAGPEQLARFARESEALGRLQHPGIAQIYEAGMADSGFGPQPYFAMEFIRGESLLHYAEAHKLSTRQRLEIMTRICDAVHHAHQRGIIHRDLKPGNILVDEGGEPKVLDFGVARVTDRNAQATRQTDVGQIVGTLAYMSPEQVLGDPLELDTRSDVYALGVIVYELLAGRAPYQLSPSLPEAVLAIREADPAPLGSVNRAYRGDVETIVAKALEKDKARRYASAAGMAEDIHRYLNEEPIVARPPNAAYRMGKFARRHKALMAGASVVFAVLIAGIVAITLEAARALHAEQVALRESATAQAVNDFLQNDLLAQASAATQAGPNTKPDPDLKVRTALDRAAVRITGRFEGQPEVEAAIRETIGQTYMDLGLYPETRTQLERALELHRRVLGSENRKTLKTISRLGRTSFLQGKYPEAEALFSQALKIQRRVLGSEHPDTLFSMNGLAATYYSQAKYAQVEALFSQTVQIQRRVLGPQHPDTLSSMNNLAVVFRSQGKYPQAEALFRLTLEMRRRGSGPEHPSTLLAANNLANVYYEQGKFAQAEALYKQTLEIQLRVLGPEHPDTVRSMNNMANVYYSQGKYPHAEALYSRALEIRRRVLGAEHPNTLNSISNLAIVYRSQCKYAQAEALFSRTLELERRLLGPEHPVTLNTLSDLAFLYQRQSKYRLAETHAAQALDGRRRALGSEHPDTMASAADLALVYLSLGKFAESEPLARESLDFYRRKQPDEWQRFRAESLLGASLAGQKKYAEGEPQLLEGYRGMVARRERIAVPDQYHLDYAREWINRLYPGDHSERAANGRERFR
jgi:tetratricopeptide (TPR) repeat protein